MATQQKEMSFMDHLEDLRGMLIRSTVAIIIMACVSFFFMDFIFDEIIFGPKNPDFVTYRFFCEIAKFFGSPDSDACATTFDFRIQNTVLGGQISIFIWMGIAAGFILAFPYILWEIWKFIKPALYEKERRSAASFVILSSILFFLGVLFGYFIIIPLSINFFATFSISANVVNDINIESYISLVKTSVIAAGLVFELPIIIYFLARLGLVTADFLRRYRKFAIVLILIVAAIVTPPEVTSQVVVSIPILILYEISILIAAAVNKKEKNEQLSTGV
jgi:sec-independent protein translocase protein TatC